MLEPPDPPIILDSNIFKLLFLGQIVSYPLLNIIAHITHELLFGQYLGLSYSVS